MKYRVQLNAIFNDNDANDILDHIESIKTKVFKAETFTEVGICRCGKKLEKVEDLIVATEYDSVDFDGGSVSHTTDHGQSEYEVEIDVSFDIQQDYFDLLNYIESIKSKAISTIGHVRNCRFFICNHDEKPLIKDGDYSYIDFDGEILNH